MNNWHVCIKRAWMYIYVGWCVGWRQVVLCMLARAIKPKLARTRMKTRRRDCTTGQIIRQRLLHREIRRVDWRVFTLCRRHCWWWFGCHGNNAVLGRKQSSSCNPVYPLSMGSELTFEFTFNWVTFNNAGEIIASQPARNNAPTHTVTSHLARLH